MGGADAGPADSPPASADPPPSPGAAASPGAGPCGGKRRPSFAPAAGWRAPQHGGHYSFAVLVTGHPNAYTREKYGNYGILFEQLLRDSPEEAWDYFYTCDGEIPSVDDLMKYQAVIITGSKADAHGCDPWILRLKELLKQLHERRQRMLGVCFGHQVLSGALGGRSGRAPAGWEAGVHEVITTPDFLRQRYAGPIIEAICGPAAAAKAAAALLASRGVLPAAAPAAAPAASPAPPPCNCPCEPPRFFIEEIHHDQVYEAPPDAFILASSAHTPVEMFAIGDHVLAMQGHPELPRDVVEEIIQLREGEGRMPPAVAEAARRSFELHAPHTAALQALCKAFLKDPLPPGVPPQPPPRRPAAGREEVGSAAAMWVPTPEAAAPAAGAPAAATAY